MIPPSTPRARFQSKGTTPPVGWVYEIRHEGVDHSFQDPMRSGLMTKLRQWHRAHGVSWPGDEEMAERVEHYICQLVPKGFCYGGPDSPRIPFLSVSAIRTATRLFYDRMVVGKDSMVEPEEAERRALTCANCPRNLHGICTSCAGNQFSDIFVWLVRRGRKTKYDDTLDTCSVCGCLLKAKIHVSLQTLAALERKSYPSNCWLYRTEAHIEPEDAT